MYPVLTHGPPPEYLRFNETLNPTRTAILLPLIKNNFAIDHTYTTFRIGYAKGYSLAPQPPSGSKYHGNQIDVFLGDDKRQPTIQGKATVIRCVVTLWRYIGLIKPYHQDPSFQNCLDGDTPRAVLHWLNQYYQKFNPPVTPITPATKISIITIGL